jgi:hypothetical protein
MVGSMIPRILHFTWKDENPPRPMRRYFEGWKRLHPDWEVRLWTDASMRRFVADGYPALLATYDGYPRMIQRADAFRCLVLGKVGGVYADLDVEPLRPIDGLLQWPAFVGVEPIEHIAPDRLHAGLPFLFSNAFMGAPAGHPLFALVTELLPSLADQETFYSTGPSMLTAAVLRLPPRDRPALLLPKLWSPRRDGGMPTRGDEHLRTLLAEIAPVVESGGGALVSLRWMTTWVKWHQRYTPLLEVGQIPSRVKWWARRRLLHRELAGVKIADPLRLYTDQRPEPAAATPEVFVAIRLDGADPLSPELSAAVARLDYPASRLRVGVESGAQGETQRAAVRQSVDDLLPGAELRFGPEDAPAHTPAARTRANNRLLQRGAEAGWWTLLLGGGVVGLSPDALRRALGAGRPVVSVNLRDAGGTPDLSVFRYNWRPDFRILYKLDGRTGAVRRDRRFRAVPDDERAFPLVALDGVGDDFVLVDPAVTAAGVRFAEAPYKLHRNGEAFGIMARDLGFEAAALTGVRVVTKRAEP